jgi:hypothetical protein
VTRPSRGGCGWCTVGHGALLATQQGRQDLVWVADGPAGLGLAKKRFDFFYFQMNSNLF